MSSPNLFDRHSFKGIGAASASLVLAALSTRPELVFLTKGALGKLSYWLLTQIFSRLASVGLVMMNVGVSRIRTAVLKVGFDTSWQSAEKLISEIRAQGRDLTEEEINSIDADVIDAFRKFAQLAGKKKQK